jgi:hypothetical protein
MSADAAVSTFPLWGKAWELTITSAAGGITTSANAGAATQDATASTTDNVQTTVIRYDTWLPEPLRITFDVLQSMNTAPLWYADISVYNMDSQLAQSIAVNATWATLKAGFQSTSSPNYMATIWDGPVFQVIYTREAVVDQKLTLHCCAIPGKLGELVSFSMGQFSSQQQLIARMISENNLPPVGPKYGTQGSVAEVRMSATQYPRGNTVFGKVSKFMAQMADSNFVQTWNDGKQVYISEVTDSATGNVTAAPDFIYSPAFPPGGTESTAGLPAGTNQSITGTPQQIQQGVEFSVLLDPRLRVKVPPLLVQLVRTNISQLLRTPSINGDLPTALASNLTFFVGQIRHMGDSRGNDWHTEVTGWSTAYAQTLLSLYT